MQKDARSAYLRKWMLTGKWGEPVEKYEIGLPIKKTVSFDSKNQKCVWVSEKEEHQTGKALSYVDVPQLEHARANCWSHQKWSKPKIELPSTSRACVNGAWCRRIDGGRLEHEITVPAWLLAGALLVSTKK